MGKKGARVETSEDRFVWQDREIRFDEPLSHLEPREGEQVMDHLAAVEDTKGNNGERGSLRVSNLRIIWMSEKNSRINLSIGFNCVINISIHSTSSRLRGHTKALYVLTKFGDSRFEFIFTNLVRQSPRLFTTVQAVHRAYETSKMYRDIKLRGAIIRDKQLLLLPGEEIYDKVGGVMNLSSDQGNLGTFFVTNVRVVWHANLAENFNVSVPYMQVKSIGTRETKFGNALVISTTTNSGGYILGFRVDPPEKLVELYQELESLHELYTRKPNFGVELAHDEKPQTLEQVRVPHKPDEFEIIGTDDDAVDTFAVYYAEGSKNADRPPIFSEELGLCVERPREGTTVKDLWWNVGLTHE